jgi:hypothetical protein
VWGEVPGDFCVEVVGVVFLIGGLCECARDDEEAEEESLHSVR